MAILADVFGPTMTARIADVADSATIKEWTLGSSEPDKLIAHRLRITLSIADALLEYDPPAVVRTWFRGPQPHARG